MKRKQFVAAVVAASVVAAGLTAWGVNSLVSSKLQTTKEVRVVEFANGGVGNHFTNYDREKYPDLTYAAENSVQAVVNVEKIEEIIYSSRSMGRNPFFDFFGIPEGYYGEQQPQSQERRSGGSGVIISPDGYIVTNNHVIENASKLKVTLNDDRTFDAEIIGSDPTTDVALIKIDAKDLPTLVFGNSNDLRLGEWVLAIGSPFDLRSTVTAGIISAKSRDLNVIPSEFRIESFIQTDAAVNPGNSGGALVNVRGELIGINTVIKSPTGSFTGYSFAVPSTIVQKVVEDLKEYGVVQRGLLGVQYQAINNGKIYENDGKGGFRETEVGEQRGLYVAAVSEGSAAEDAGIKEGDIITEVDGMQMSTASSLSEYIGTKRPNEKVKVSVKREGKVKQFEVVLRNKAGKAEPVTKFDLEKELGGKFVNVTEREKRELQINGGIKVTSIKEGGYLSNNKVRKNFIITHINDVEINSFNDLDKIDGKISSIDGVYPDGRSASY